METAKAFVCLLIIYITQFRTALSRNNRLHFEFSHHEVLAISDADDEVEDYYYYDDPINDQPKEGEQSHNRRRRSVKWAPNYDLYEQWAEEYYSQNEESNENAEHVVQPKQSLLDKLILKTQKKTPEEIEQESKEEQQKRDVLKSTIKYGSWTLGIIVLFFFIITLIKRCWSRIMCDFCDIFSFKKKIKNLVNNMVPGVYVHKNGKKEYYKPTKEELEAVKDIKKILFSLA